ncbi:non-canonical purine NTP diphosphatase [Maribacter polysiphoniae]|uniref:non-canonical purine NTP diphosphatase n=1 Tax=Maribacter polysiphoniae TaxID=429344 RepID=UPI002353675E|nr:non-canonical purine NTP diphosphatase [Maribacter polysiphoniae]
MKLVFATHNQNKVKEVQALLPKNISLLSLTDIGCNEEIPETGKTLKENAIIKADFVTKHFGLPCFADDTGLLVDALNGAPGVYSARYAGEQGNSDNNMDKLLSELKSTTHRSARFETVIALNLENSQHIFTGTVEGEIIDEKKGDKGFGYDPIFRPKTYSHTFAELPMAVKNKISHRGKAIKELLIFLKSLANDTE